MKHTLKTVRNWLLRVQNWGFRNTVALKRHLKRDGQFSLTVNRHKFFLRGNTVDFAVLNSIFRKGEYDIDYGFEPEIIVDLGANIGASTLFFRMRYPGAKIYAVEPERSNFDLLKKNTEAYQNITLANCAVWPENRDLVISNPDAEKYAFKMDEAHGHAETVRGVKLESLMEEWRLMRIDLLKIDIEGAEKSLFDRQDLSWLSKTRVLVVELHDLIEPGTTQVFMKALENINCEVWQQGENHIVINKDF